MAGIGYLIGAGPGDPGLLTVKGQDCLKKADVVIYDYLADDSLLFLTRPDAELIYAGKQAGKHTLKQSEINALLVEKVAQGHTVARLKGGDPFVFGRGGEEALALRENNLAFEIVPGVTSAIAAPAYAGIPVTHRAVATSFAVVTGHEDPTKPEASMRWEHLATGVDTLTFVMGLGKLRKIVGELIAHGRPATTPAAVVRWGTKAEQETVVSTLAELPAVVEAAGLKPPGLLVIGEVVALRDKLRWFEDQPLFGKRIVVTRAADVASVLGEKLAHLGAQPLYIPAIRRQATDNTAEQKQAVQNAASHDYLLFTSPYTVERFFAVLMECGRDSRDLATLKIAAVGSKTAEKLRRYGIVADIVPETAQAEGLLAALKDEVMTGKRVLLPRAVQARELLPETLRKAGAVVDVVPFYETVPETSRKDIFQKELQSGKISAITFTSASTVTGLLAMLEDPCKELAGIPLIAIGEITADALRQAGLEPDRLAAKATQDAMVDAVLDVFRKEANV